MTPACARYYNCTSCPAAVAFFRSRAGQGMFCSTAAGDVPTKHLVMPASRIPAINCVPVQRFRSCAAPETCNTAPAQIFQDRMCVCNTAHSQSLQTLWSGLRPDTPPTLHEREKNFAPVHRYVNGHPCRSCCSKISN